MKRKTSLKKFVSLVLVFAFLLALPVMAQANNERFIAWTRGNYAIFTLDTTPISTTTDRWGRYVHTINLGTTLFADGEDWWRIHPATPEGYNQDSILPWVVLTATSRTFVFNTVGRFNICGEKEGGFTLIVIANNVATPSPTPAQTPSPTPTATPSQTPLPAGSIPEFVSPPTSVDTGVWMEFTTIQNNRYGYRIFRATTATGDGISITDFPILVNPAHRLDRIITFDPNVRPDRDYWYYIREVLEEAHFCIDTMMLTPEVLGPPSARVHVRTSSAITEPLQERGFIMMFIGNPYMNVNNVWEGIDPPNNRTAPVITAGRTMVPVRAIIEAMGGTADWNNSERRADLRSHGNHVQMWLG